MLVALSPSSLVVSEKSKSIELSLDTGQTLWIATGQEERLLTAGLELVELLRFDFKTKPLSKETLEQDKKHQYPEK